MPRKPPNKADCFPPGRALPALLDLSRQVLFACLRELAGSGALKGKALVDGTCGNGHDTFFLAECLRRLDLGGQCPIYSFDVQESALAAARRLLADMPEHGATFLLADHAALRQSLAERGVTEIILAVYNLGFLPGSDKSLTTNAARTLPSLTEAAALMLPGGLLCVHAYGGHGGGLDELTAVDSWFCGLAADTWQAARYEMCNKGRNPEALFLARRRNA